MRVFTLLGIQTAEWSYLHGSVVWLDMAAYLFDKAGEPGSPTQEINLSLSATGDCCWQRRKFPPAKRFTWAYTASARTTLPSDLPAAKTPRLTCVPQWQTKSEPVSQLEGNPPSLGLSRGEYDSASSCRAAELYWWSYSTCSRLMCVLCICLWQQKKGGECRDDLLAAVMATGYH